MCNTKGILKARPVTFRGVTYPSTHALSKWAKANGYNVEFYTIRLAMDLGRDLEEVFAGKKFDRKYNARSIVYKGVEYASASALYRHLYHKRKRVYISKPAFVTHIHKHGVESAVHRLLHKHISNAYISRRLGGSNNLILLRIKNGWDPKRAMNERCGAWRKKGKKHE